MKNLNILKALVLAFAIQGSVSAVKVTDLTWAIAAWKADKSNVALAKNLVQLAGARNDAVYQATFNDELSDVERVELAVVASTIDSSAQQAERKYQAEARPARPVQRQQARPVPVQRPQAQRIQVAQHAPQGIENASNSGQVVYPWQMEVQQAPQGLANVSSGQAVYPWNIEIQQAPEGIENASNSGQVVYPWQMEVAQAAQKEKQQAEVKQVAEGRMKRAGKAIGIGLYNTGKAIANHPVRTAAALSAAAASAAYYKNPELAKAYVKAGISMLLRSSAKARTNFAQWQANRAAARVIDNVSFEIAPIINFAGYIPANPNR